MPAADHPKPRSATTARRRLASSASACSAVAADARLQLDLGGEDLGGHPTRHVGPDRLDHILGRRRQAAGVVDQKQLFLDPERERGRTTETVLAGLLLDGGHG